MQYYDTCWTPILWDFDSGLGSEDRMEVIVTPLFVRPIGIGGGFWRFGGAGGGRLRLADGGTICAAGSSKITTCLGERGETGGEREDCAERGDCS